MDRDIWKKRGITCKQTYLNMYNLNIQIYMLWDIEKQVILLAQLYSYLLSWIIQAKQASDAEIERNTPITTEAARQC